MFNNDLTNTCNNIVVLNNDAGFVNITTGKTVTLSSSLVNFKFIVLDFKNGSSSILHRPITLPVQYFKLTTYNINDWYDADTDATKSNGASFKYIDDTHIHVFSESSSTSTYYIAIYGIY